MTRGNGRYLNAAGVLTDAYGTPIPDDAPQGAPEGDALPSLASMTKAELSAQAEAEGVEFSASGLTNDEMRAEIEAARAV